MENQTLNPELSFRNLAGRISILLNFVLEENICMEYCFLLHNTAGNYINCKDLLQLTSV